jgi:hypothetical protein
MPKLDKQAAAWLDNTLKGMSLEEAVAHLIMPEDRNYQPADWLGFMKEVPLSCVFVSERAAERTKACLAAIQERSRVPVVAAATWSRALATSPADSSPTRWPWARPETRRSL